MRSSTAPRGGAGPTAPIDDVCTTRSTPARSASSITVRVPSTLTRSSSAGVRAQVRRAGDVEDAVDAAQRPAQRGAVAELRDRDLDVEAVERLARRAGAQRHAHVVAALDERARDVRARRTPSLR